MTKSLTILTIVGMLIAGSSFAAETLNMSGSSTVRPIVKDAAKIFKKTKGIEIKVAGGGSSVGVKDVMAGTTDIGMASRALKATEPTNAVAHTIGQDGIAIIVHSSNPIKAITKQQVIDIYTGKIKNWKELGGNDQTVTIESKEEGRSTKELFEKFFGLKGKIISGIKEVGSNTESIAFVSNDPTAMGYVSIGSGESAVKNGIDVKLLTLDGIVSSSKTVSNGTYPLRRPLNVVTKGEATGTAKLFIDFLLSDEGQKLVAKRGFVTLK